MGIAAYNRGTTALSAQIDCDLRPVEFEIMERLNALPKYPDAGTPFSTIQFINDEIHGGVWAQCPITGFGFWYPNLNEAVQRWRITITGHANHRWIAEPMRRVA